MSGGIVPVLVQYYISTDMASLESCLIHFVASLILQFISIKIHDRDLATWDNEYMAADLMYMTPSLRILHTQSIANTNSVISALKFWAVLDLFNEKGRWNSEKQWTSSVLMIRLEWIQSCITH